MNTLVFKGKNFRVLYDSRNNIYNIQRWMDCDNPRTYGRHYDYCTVKQCNTTHEVVKYLDENKMDDL